MGSPVERVAAAARSIGGRTRARPARPEAFREPKRKGRSLRGLDDDAFLSTDAAASEARVPELRGGDLRRRGEAPRARRRNRNARRDRLARTRGRARRRARRPRRSVTFVAEETTFARTIQRCARGLYHETSNRASKRHDRRVDYIYTARTRRVPRVGLVAFPESRRSRAVRSFLRGDFRRATSCVLPSGTRGARGGHAAFGSLRSPRSVAAFGRAHA